MTFDPGNGALPAEPSAGPGIRALERTVWWVARALCAISGVAITAMVGVTVVDVLLRQFGEAIPGAFELVTLGMRIGIPLAMPYAFWAGAHIAVELVTDRLRPWVASAIIACGLLISTAVMALLAWCSYRRALDVWRFGDLTPDLGWPEVIHWIPLVAGSALCVPVILVLAVRHARLVARSFSA